MPNRKVELLLTHGQLTEIAVETNTWDKLWQAIGYLSTWSAYDYPIVRIHRDGKTDMVAVYLKGDGELGYVIGAVWNDTTNTYGFHS